MPNFVAPTSAKALKAVSSGAIQNATRFLEKLTALNQKVQLKQAEIDRNIELAGPDRSKAAQAHYAGELKDFLRQFRKDTEEERYSILREISGASEAVKEFASLNLTSAVRLASAHGIGTESRARIEQSLSKARPATLAMLAKKASLEKDFDTAAVLFSIGESLPRNERSFDTNQLAEDVWHEQAAENKAMVDATEKAFAVSMASNREFDGIKISPTEKVRLGFNYEGLSLPQQESSQHFSRKSSVEMIGEGLDAM